MLLVEDDAIDVMTVRRAFRDLKLANPLAHATNGVEFMKVAKADPVLREIPVIVFTTSRDDRDIVESYRLSVAGYIVKPVDYRKFVEAIRLVDLDWTINELPEDCVAVGSAARDAGL